jgi:hypothetical protein
MNLSKLLIEVGSNFAYCISAFFNLQWRELKKEDVQTFQDVKPLTWAFLAE